MGKRKGSVPQRVEEGKRKALSWNMLADDPPPIIYDGDPSFLPPSSHSVAMDTVPDIAEEISVGETLDENGEERTKNSYYDELFKLHLEFCSFYISVWDKLNVNEDEWSCEIGRFHIQISANQKCHVRPQDYLSLCQECWIYVGQDGHRNMLYFENTDMGNSLNVIDENLPMFWFVEITLPVLCLQALEAKAFQVVRGEFTSESGTLELIVFARESVLARPKFASEYIRPTRTTHAAMVLMEHFYGIRADHRDEIMPKSHKPDLDRLYSAVKQHHASNKPSVSVEVQHPCLKPVLRPYQRHAVGWMLRQERFHEPRTENGEKRLHSLYEAVTMADGKELYYNRRSGMLVEERPVETEGAPGGLLADEMGLGKTVEVLSCLLLHPRGDVTRPDRLPTLLEVEVIQEESEDASLTADQSDTTEDMAVSVKVEEKEHDVSQTSEVVEMNILQDASSMVGVLERNVDEKMQVNMDQNGEDSSTQDPDPTQAVDPTGEGQVNVMMETGEGDVDKDRQEKMGNDSEDSSPQDPQIARDTAVTGDDSVAMVTVHGQVESGDDIHPDSKNDFENQIKEVSCETDRETKVGENSLIDNIIHQQDEGVAMEVVADEEDARRDGNSELGKSIKERNVTFDDETSMDAIMDSERLNEIASNSDVCDNTSTSQHPTQTEPQTDKLRGSTTRKRKKKKLTYGKKRKNRRSPAIIVSLDNEEEPTENAPRKVEKIPRKKSEKKFEVLVEEKDFKPATFFTDTAIRQKQWFECVCGGDMDDRRSQRKKLTNVQCIKCGMWQHAQCLHYDLNNPYRGPYMCPHCHVSAATVPSGATLIISPASICHQWAEEIRKHVRQDAIKVFIYTGVNKLGFIQPQTLAACDIVITTYETLRKEIDYVDLPHSNSSAGRRFRHRKRFLAIPSPIIAVDWWRICLDEAQMVECTTTKTAEMALRLSGVNRWCVTGTPIQKSVKDLYGLLLFLGVDPYWVEAWWNRLLYLPFSRGQCQPLYNLLSQVMWRTCKNDVLDQVLLPPQSQSLHWLTFSPVEDHFYRRQYRDCVKDASQRLGKWKDNSVKLRSMDRHTLSQLLQPLLRLRQACCHPQAVRGEFLPLNKNTMTMEELLESLTRKARVESEEAHRQKVAAINGLAGLHVIREQYTEAVDMYRLVFQTVTEHSDLLRTDDLQQLHALHNLDEILSTSPAGVLPTLRDHQLKQQAAELRQKYMQKAAGKVTSAQHTLTPAQQSVTDNKKTLGNDSEWWVELLGATEERGLDGELIGKVQEDIEAFATSFHDLRGLQFIIYTHVAAIERCRGQLVKAVQSLAVKPKMDVVNSTVQCCLRPIKEPLRNCPFCKADDLFNSYESKLFSFKEKGVVSVGEEEGAHQVNTKRQGTWADSDVEKTLKSILAFCRHHGVAHRHKPLLDSGTTHIKLLDSMKKEFKHLRTMWLASREQVSAVDELTMATTRLRVRLPDEEKPEEPQPNVLERGEIDTHRMKLIGEKANAEVELKRKLGQLLYLTNLAKSQEGKDSDGTNPDPCPVCQKALGQEWSVLLCGHCYCLDCIRIMVDQYSFGGRNRSLKCALCRQTTHHSDISYVSTKKTPESDKAKVVGSHSTKVEAVVRCINQIHREEPSAKILVFSTWQDVLDVIGKALHQNDLEFRAMHAPGKFQKNLREFKTRDDVITLLIPLHSGANGLNLIEATHVLLVEPILNPAEELQAIGRVHRIGQTKPTHIHKFLVRGTIEQRIFNLVRSLPMCGHEKEDSNMTIGDLASLFTEVTQEEAPPSEQTIIMETQTTQTDTSQTSGIQTDTSGTNDMSVDPQASTSGTNELSIEPQASTSGTNELSIEPQASTSGTNELSIEPQASTSGTNNMLAEPQTSTSETNNISADSEASTSGTKNISADSPAST